MSDAQSLRSNGRQTSGSYGTSRVPVLQSKPRRPSSWKAEDPELFGFRLLVHKAGCDSRNKVKIVNSKNVDPPTAVESKRWRQYMFRFFASFSSQYQHNHRAAEN